MDTDSYELLIELMVLSQDIGRGTVGDIDKVYEQREEIAREILKRMEAQSG